MRTLIAAYAALVLTIPTAARGVGQQPFTASAALDGVPAAAGDTVTVKVSIAIPADHYIDRDATSAAWLDVGSLSAGEPAYPAPVTKFDKWEKKDVEIYNESIAISLPVTVPAGTADGTYPVQAEVRWRGCNPKMCFFPTSEVFDLQVVVGEGSEAPPVADGGEGATAEATTAAEDTEAPNDEPDAEETAAATSQDMDLAGLQQRLAGALEKAAGKSFLLVLLIAFLGGIAASFTPCVYPMIPITVAVIGARGTTSRAKAFSLALVYVLGIATLYSVLGVVAATTQTMLGSAFGNPWVMLAIAVLFAFLALGMFGVYNFALPSSVNTKLSQVGGQSYAGVFVIGLVGGIVISPCTGPVVGAILLMIASGQLTLAQGFGVMFVFSLGVGMLFLVIGTFSESLQRLPQAGGWMTHVKNSFGFIMILAALYFLGAAGFLPDGIIGMAMAVSLVMWGVVLGVFTPMEPEAGWPAWILRTVAVVLIMVGFLMLGRALYGTGDAGGSHAVTAEAITWETDIQAALDRAEAEGLPLMFDFTQDNCPQCRELEHKTFPDPGVVQRSRSFVSVTVDMTQLVPLEESLAEKYGVPGAPRIVFCRPDGAEIEGTAIQGYVPPGTYTRSMDRALDAL